MKSYSNPRAPQPGKALRVVAYVPIAIYAALDRERRTRKTIPTMSELVGEILEAWAKCR